MHVTVCICTFKRPRYLRRALEELKRQETDGRFTYSIVVVDNDRTESARMVATEAAADSPVSIVYCVEPEQNIALARNRAMANVSGEFIAFIDDDEFPGQDWLRTLLAALERYGADGVLGPVRPYFEQEPPAWLVRSRLCERPEHETGLVLDWRYTRTGNVLFRRAILDGVAEPFRKVLGNGGEDGDFFKRMIAQGRVFVWCNEAPVQEIVPPERWTRRYYLKRALLSGQNQRHHANVTSVAKSLVAFPAYTFMLPFLFLAGDHVAMRYLLKLAAHGGKLAGVSGFKPMGDRYFSS